MIILIGGEKGGTGKTTLATNLAGKRASDGVDVLIVDTDPQGSANAWAELRDEEGVIPRIPVIQKFGKGLGAELKDLAKRYQDIIVDAGGRDSFEMRSALTVCHAVYTPLQASQFDVWTMSQMNQLVADAQALNENLRAFAVINRASTNPMVGEANEAKQLLSDLDALELIKPIIRERIAYRKAVAQGKYVGELNPSDEKAIIEISALYREVFQNET